VSRSRRIFRALAVVVLLAAPATEASEVLIPSQSVWSYLDDGSDQGSAWREPGFQESWSRGRAELGFGDEDRGAEGTVLQDNGMTCYFRRSFELTREQLDRVAGLRLGVRRDDGVVVYLNGHELYRLGLEPGPVAYDDDGQPTFSESHFYRWYVGPEHLRLGTNVVAVEMHKANERDSDLSFDLELSAVTSDDAEIWRGPYLQRGTRQGVTLRFLTSVPVTPTLRWGPDPTELSSSSDGDRGTQHTFELDGLDSDTFYYYSIEADGRRLAGADRDHRFRTHPGPGTDRPLRIWVIGDAGDGQFSESRIALSVYEDFTGTTPTDVWLMLGDNAYKSGTTEEHQDAVFDAFSIKLRNTISWPIIGNHDKRSFTGESAGPYFDVFDLPTAGESGGVASGSEYYYSFDYGDIHFVALYSSLGGLDAGHVQLDWLERDLAASDAEWTIAMLHIAPYSTGEHPSDTLERHVAVRQNALPILEKHGVDLVLAGHSHCYQRSYPVRGHYGTSETWDPAQHLVDGGDGCPDDERASECSGNRDGPYDGDGTVYVIVGNSSTPEESGPLDHPVVAYGELDVVGSLVIDVEGQRLEARFLREDAVVADRFVIVHEQGVRLTPALLLAILALVAAVVLVWRRLA
jgi:hypothetical protein